MIGEKMRLCAIFLMISVVFLSFGDEVEIPASNISSEKEYREIGVKELILKNGMKVWLKPMDFGYNETIVQLTALGGYSALESCDRVSGKLAAKVACESGLGKLSSDQIAALLYDDSLEFNTQIFPFSRIIEAITNRAGMQTILKLIQMQFTEKKFNEESFQLVLNDSKNTIKRKFQNNNTSIDDWVKNINTDGYFPLHKLTQNELEKADYEKSKRFYENSFYNPKEFVCIIVGDFDLQKTISLVDHYLATIPNGEDTGKFNNIKLPAFTTRITSKKIKSNQKGQAITRLSIPLQSNFDGTHNHLSDFMTRVIRKSLESMLKKRLKNVNLIEVVHCFPFYPYYENSWLVVQFSSDSTMICSVVQQILSEINYLQKHGPSEKEVLQIQKMYQETDKFWLRNSRFWVSALTENALFDWDPNHIRNQYEQLPNVDSKTIKKVVSEQIFLKSYTVISSVP